MKEFLVGFLAGAVVLCHDPVIYGIAWLANQAAHLVIR